MRTVECDALLVRAQGGEPAAWTTLALLMHREVEIIAALYAADQTMVEAVCADCWPIAQQWLTDQRYPQRAKTGFMLGTPNESKLVLQQLCDAALGVLRQRLMEYDREAIANKDAVYHLIAQSGLEALPRSSAEVPNVLPLINERLKRSSPAIQGLMIKRQRERMSVTQMAGIAGRSAGQVAHAICQARNTTDWHPGGALPVASGDGDFPLMIEEFIDGTLAAELYTGLVQILLGDLDSTACFVRQIRLDLVLTACLHLDAADATHLLNARAATPTQGNTRRAPISERIVQSEVPEPEARPITAATRNPKLRKSTGAANNSNANKHLGVMLGAGGAVLLVIAAVVFMSQSAKTPRPPTTDNPTVVEHPHPQDKPTDSPAAKPAVDTSIRIEAGQPTVRRDGARLRLKPGDTLRGDEAFDSDASAGPVVLALSGGRKLTVGVNSAVSGVQFDTSGAADGADNVLVSRGHLRIEAPAGSRGVTLRSGSATAVSNGAAFSLTTLGSGQRVEVSRGSVRLQRGSAPVGTVLTGQMATLNDNGEVQVMSAGTFVFGINLGGASVTLDDHRWKSQRHGEADGLTISGGNPVSAPVSADVSAALRSLLESGLSGNARLSQTLPDGTYDVVCWITGRPGSTMSTVTIEGQADAATTGDSAALDASGWRRLTPRRCVVSGGRLTLNFSGTADQLLAGVMIQTGGTDVAGKPTVRLPPTIFLDYPGDGLNRPAPVTLTCKAQAYVPDGEIRSVEFLVDGAKVGEATKPPYLISWTGEAPGAHQLAARVVSSNGLSANVPGVGLTIKPAEKSAVQPPQPILPGEVYLVDDLERGADGWEYVGGWEFPGAIGAAARDAGAIHGGHHAYRLDYDFSAGGVYVGIWKKLENLAVPNISEVRFWVKVEGITSALGIRLADGSGQLHQSSIALQATNDWQEVVVKISQATGGEHWAGANDGKWYPSIKGLGVNVGKGNGTTGTIWFDDLRVVIAAP